MNLTKHLSFLLGLLLFCTSCPHLAASDLSGKLPATFVRVGGLDALTGEGLYVLGAIDLKGRLVLLSTTALKAQKMKGTNLNHGLKDELPVATDSEVWTLKRGKGNEIRLCAANGKGWLTRTAAGKLGLALRAAESDLCTWQASEAAGGGFLLADPAANGRSLSVASVYSATLPPHVFDNYSSPDTPVLHVFKLPESYSDTAGPAVLPDEGAVLALTARHFVRLNGGTAQQADEAMLCNGTLAPLDGLETWTAARPDSRTFTLHDGRGNYLGYDLQATSRPSTWQVANGHICTTEEVPRFLCFDSAQAQWKVAREEDAQIPAGLASVAPAPQLTCDEAGVCRLTGGWRATDLARISLEGVRCIDLTQTALPLRAKAFEQMDAASNVPVFVKEEQTDFVPVSWKFAVSCGKTNRLMHLTELTDREPFYTDRDFQIEAGQLFYVRTAAESDSWQTLCLPFPFQAPAGTDVCRLTSTAGDSLHYETAGETEAGHPCLIRIHGTSSVRLESRAGSVEKTPASGEPLCGTYLPYTVGRTEDKTFLLAPGTNEFRQAAAGSQLPPFRAYLKLHEGSPAAKRLQGF